MRTLLSISASVDLPCPLCFLTAPPLLKKVKKGGRYVRTREFLRTRAINRLAAWAMGMSHLLQTQSSRMSMTVWGGTCLFLCPPITSEFLSTHHSTVSHRVGLYFTLLLSAVIVGRRRTKSTPVRVVSTIYLLNNGGLSEE